MFTTCTTLLVFILVTSWSCDVTATCPGPKGSTVLVGTAWVAQDGCNVCQCTAFGVECQTWKNCNNANHLGQYGSPVCMYQNVAYTVGQEWDVADGCNHCQCLSVGMNCTYKACSNSGFAHSKPAGSFQEFMDCRYNDVIYRYEDQFLADDGCNTCYCIMPGNYATFPACTTTPCALIG